MNDLTREINNLIEPLTRKSNGLETKLQRARAREHFLQKEITVLKEKIEALQRRHHEL